jgi:hypothetical protein
MLIVKIIARLREEQTAAVLPCRLSSHKINDISGMYCQELIFLRRLTPRNDMSMPLNAGENV